MKLWDSLTTCLFLLSSVHASPPTQHRRQPSTTARNRAHPNPTERPLETPPVDIRLLINPAANTPAVHTEPDDPERMADREPHAAGVRLAERLAERLASAGAAVGPAPRPAPATPSPTPSPSATPSLSTPSVASRGHLSSGARRRGGKKKAARVRSTRGGRGGGAGGAAGGGGGGGGAKEAARRNAGRRGRGGQGCMLKQIHLNVSDLGLGYRSEEELIFRYCAGPCRKSETNYDKILHSIAPSRRLGARDPPPFACCRPIAFDDDLSFLDDNLVYHTIRKHSARKCGCV